MKNRYQDVLDNLDLIKSYEAMGKPLAEVAKLLNMNYLTVLRHLNKIGYSYEKNQGRRGMIRYTNKPMQEYLNASSITNARKRQYLIDNKIKESRCEMCGKSTWLDKPIPLELHHADFNHHNYNLRNLMILCPNCHSYLHLNKDKQ